MSTEALQTEIEQRYNGLEVGIVRDVRITAHQLLAFCGIESNLEIVSETERLIRDHIHAHPGYGIDVILEDEDYPAREDFDDMIELDPEFSAKCRQRDKEREEHFRYWHQRIYGDSPTII